MGSDPIGLVPRNTFDLWWLGDGIPLPPLVIGVFAMSMVYQELLHPEIIGTGKQKLADVASLLKSKSEGCCMNS